MIEVIPLFFWGRFHPDIDENGSRKVAGSFCILRGDGQLAGDRQVQLRSQEITLQVAQQAGEEGIHVLEEVPNVSEEIPPSKAMD